MDRSQKLQYDKEWRMKHAINFTSLERRGIIEADKIEGRKAYRTNVRVKAGVK